MGSPPLASLPEAALVLVMESAVVVAALVWDSVVGVLPAAADADDVELPLVDPPVVTLNMLLCARMAGLWFVALVIKLIWKPWPVGHAPSGYVTVADWVEPRVPVDWFAVSVTSELDMKPCWFESWMANEVGSLETDVQDTCWLACPFCHIAPSAGVLMVMACARPSAAVKTTAEENMAGNRWCVRV